MRVGFAGFVLVCGTDTVDAPLGSLPSPLGIAENLPDFKLDEALPGRLSSALVSILGASSSVSQLHCEGCRQLLPVRVTDKSNANVP